MAEGIFALVGEVFADLAAKVFLEVGRMRLFPSDKPKRGPSDMIPSAPETIDVDSVIAAYRGIIGVEADLGERLLNGSLTPVATLAALGDFALIVALIEPVVIFVRDFGVVSVGLAWIVLASLGYLLARGGDPRPAQERPTTSLPLGIFTGLVLRARLKHRYERVAREPFSADDPLVIGPVAQLWSREPLARAQSLLEPGSGLLSESMGAVGIIRSGGDPIVSRELEARTGIVRMELRRATEAMRAFLADPESIDRSPLRAAQGLFTALRNEIAVAEHLVTETAIFRRTFPIGMGSLEGPVRLNETA